MDFPQTCFEVLFQRERKFESNGSFNISFAENTTEKSGDARPSLVNLSCKKRNENKSKRFTQNKTSDYKNYITKFTDIKILKDRMSIQF